MKSFLRKGNDLEFLIDYPGYSPRVAQEVIDEIFLLNQGDEDVIYPKLAILLADLWTQLWQNGREQAPQIPVHVLRTSYIEELLALYADYD